MRMNVKLSGAFIYIVIQLFTAFNSCRRASISRVSNSACLRRFGCGDASAGLKATSLIRITATISSLLSFLVVGLSILFTPSRYPKAN